MGGLVRLVLTFGKFAVLVIVAGVILYLTVLLLNRGIQWFAAQFGYEVGDFFQWLKSKMPRIEFKKKGTK